MSSEGIDAGDKISEAKKRVQAGPVPDWVSERIYDVNFKSREGDHSTYLLFDRQIHAERREYFTHIAVRLESMEAVQSESQWRLKFEPRTQSNVLHFVRIRRGESAIEHLDVQKGHLLQREEGLNRFVIDGWFTFLLVLEDVRPGDILEFAYTATVNHPLLSENFSAFLMLPPSVPIGKYRLACRFHPSRPMKWKSYWENLMPMESNEDSLTRWTWTRENFAGVKPEPHTPPWFLYSPWVQVSDCPDWLTVGKAVHQVWEGQGATAQLDDVAAKIEQETTDVPLRIEKAIQFIQDEFRYLAVDLEFGGQVPTPPDVVARRRYGDCKDLSFLLASLLKRLGVIARPVLVHTGFRKTVGNLLPAQDIFNHVIVEFEAQGQCRWIDPTLNYQGGGAFNRAIHEYGFGLPVAPDVTSLVEAPKRTGQTDLYELHETMLLDTTGADCRVSAVTRAIGTYAETLRRQFAVTKMEDISRDRLQIYANRYGHAKRVEPLKFRDDRELNQFTIVEVIDINRCFQAHERPGTVGFPIPTWWLRSTLPVPAKGERRNPFALPFPCQLVHIVDIEFPSFQPALAPRYVSRGKYLNFQRTCRVGHQFWVMTFTLEVTTDFVPPEEIKKYRETAEEIWKASAINLLMPAGQARVRQKKGFGELPSPPRPKLAPIQPAAPRPAINAAAPKPQAEQAEFSMEMKTIATKAAAKPAPKEDPPQQPKSKGGFWQRLFGGS